MSVMTDLWEELREFDFMQEDHMKSYADDMVICSCSSTYKDHLHYMIVYQPSTDKYCRLNLLKPEYIGYSDEHLILTKDDIEKLYSILEYDGPYGNRVKGMNTWQSILYHTNENYTLHDTRDYYYVPMPLDMPIPDYTKLLKRKTRREKKNHA